MVGQDVGRRKGTGLEGNSTSGFCNELEMGTAKRVRLQQVGGV